MPIPFKALLALAVFGLAACGDRSGTAASGPAASAAATHADAADSDPALRLYVSGTSGTHLNEPSCMTELVVENLSDQPLLVFSAEFTPTHAATGEPLKVVGSLRAGVPRLSSAQPLAAGERGQPWKMNVTGAGCEQVRYTLGPISCGLQSGPCRGVSAEQRGLAGITPVSVAAPR